MKVYGSLQEGLHEQLGTDGVDLPRIGEKNSSSLSQVDELEKIFAHRIAKLKANHAHAEAQAAGEVRQLKQVIEVLKSKVATREMQLKEAQDTIVAKDSNYETMQENLTATIRSLQEELKKNNETLHQRQKEIKNLKMELQLLRPELMEDGSSLIAASSEPLNAMRNPGHAEGKPAGVYRTDAGHQSVPLSFFHSLIKELSEIMGPLASMIIYHDVMALGESMDKFPKARLTELLDIVSNDIADEYAKISFRERFWNYA